MASLKHIHSRDQRGTPLPLSHTSTPDDKACDTSLAERRERLRQLANSVIDTRTNAGTVVLSDSASSCAGKSPHRREIRRLEELLRLTPQLQRGSASSTKRRITSARSVSGSTHTPQEDSLSWTPNRFRRLSYKSAGVSSAPVFADDDVSCAVGCSADPLDPGSNLERPTRLPFQLSKDGAGPVHSEETTATSPWRHMEPSEISDLSSSNQVGFVAFNGKAEVAGMGRADVSPVVIEGESVLTQELLLPQIEPTCEAIGDKRYCPVSQVAGLTSNADIQMGSDDPWLLLSAAQAALHFLETQFEAERLARRSAESSAAEMHQALQRISELLLIAETPIEGSNALPVLTPVPMADVLDCDACNPAVDTLRRQSIE